jgi:hypothetical protein
MQYDPDPADRLDHIRARRLPSSARDSARASRNSKALREGQDATAIEQQKDEEGLIRTMQENGGRKRTRHYKRPLTIIREAIVIYCPQEADYIDSRHPFCVYDWSVQPLHRFFLLNP